MLIEIGQPSSVLWRMSCIISLKAGILAMTVTEILEQAKELSPEERKELARLLLALDTPLKATDNPGATWGQKLVQMMDEDEAIEMIHPEIEDATAWVKQIRRDQEVQRGLNWDEPE